MRPLFGISFRHVLLLLVTAAIAAFTGSIAVENEPSPDAPEAPADSMVNEQLLRGRLLVITHGCGDCHGGFANPANPGWLAGMQSPEQEFKIGPFTTRPRNITPHDRTGIGRFSERQIFNALRYGLRPGETPDVEITSSVPGEGNFPENPKYLAPPMPWFSFRHLSDEELWDIVAYVKRAVKPVDNLVADSEGPPDFWVSFYTPETIGTYPLPPFPALGETAP